MSPLRADRIVVPIASETDAIETADALKARFARSADPAIDVILVHVIEKSGGYIDKAPLAARKEEAEAAFAAARTVLDGSNVQVTDSVVYDTDLIEGIVTAAVEQNADAIVLRPRESGFLTRLLTGNRTAMLVRKASIPVLILPSESDTDSADEKA